MANLPYAKKSLGQHWLTDKTALEAIADSVNINKDTTVLEIGPGVGTLTAVLLKKAKKVIAVEFDEKLANELGANLGNPDNLEIINQDILKFNLTNLPENYTVVANIPYYLTSKLIRILCESTNPPFNSAILVQKEVAERVASMPGKMSLLSVSAQVYNNVSLGQVVPAHLFTPPPKVDSQVLILNRLEQPLVANNLQKDFFTIVKAGFSERRKKLRSSLSGGLHVSKADADAMIKAANLNPDSRAQELSIEQWTALVGEVGKIAKMY